MRIVDCSSDGCSCDLVNFDNPACFSFVCTGVSTRLQANSCAAFAQGTYAIGPQTNITVGARYTNEKKTSDPNNYFIDIGYGLGPLSIGNPNPNPATIIDKIGRASCRERVCQYV